MEMSAAAATMVRILRKTFAPEADAHAPAGDLPHVRFRAGMSTSESYTRTAIALHWAIAALVLFQFAWGWWMQGIPKQPAGTRVEAFNLHKSIGMTIFALMVVRLLWRATHRPPRLTGLAHWQAGAARTTHALLYAALLVQPLVGYLGSESSGFAVKLFGWTLPGWVGTNAAMKEAMSTAHLAVSWMIGAVVGLHVAAALKHALVDRNRALARMGIGAPVGRNPWTIATLFTRPH